jgi:excisionase family DNA binding protein
MSEPSPSTRKKITHDRLVVNVTEAARMLGCARTFVYKLIEQGELRSTHIAGSGAVRIPIADVYALAGIDPAEAQSITV